ncbi:hypothetical protein BDB01DRAFT_716149 [Pilobolus umbonatus]|nr:hypothetical protein BDB01DRAFT_716149 [Pilobolus umbonatus]
MDKGTRGLYFAKVANRDSSVDAVSVFYSWQGYCIKEEEYVCHSGKGVMVVPFDIYVVNSLNQTYPLLFTDRVSQDESLNPGAAPNPPHDPKIFPASVLCLLCSAALLTLCVLRIVAPFKYQDIYYTRGFLACGSAVFALLLLILSTVMYNSAIEQLNVAYPHLIATEGPCMPMIGVAFMCFALAGFVLLRGSMSLESSGSNDEGYSAI